MDRDLIYRKLHFENMTQKPHEEKKNVFLERKIKAGSVSLVTGEEE